MANTGLPVVSMTCLTPWDGRGGPAGDDKPQENPVEESPPWHPIYLKKRAAAAASSQEGRGGGVVILNKNAMKLEISVSEVWGRREEQRNDSQSLRVADSRNL